MRTVIKHSKKYIHFLACQHTERFPELRSDNFSCGVRTTLIGSTEKRIVEAVGVVSDEVETADVTAVVPELT